MDVTLQEKIRILLVRRGNLSEAELSRKLQAAGMKISPQSLNGKMKRGRFSPEELQKIGAVLNCAVTMPPPPAPIFKMNDTGEEI
jgi:hypothetical protein